MAIVGSPPAPCCGPRSRAARAVRGAVPGASVPRSGGGSCWIPGGPEKSSESASQYPAPAGVSALYSVHRRVPSETKGTCRAGSGRDPAREPVSLAVRAVPPTPRARTGPAPVAAPGPRAWADSKAGSRTATARRRPWYCSGRQEPRPQHAAERPVAEEEPPGTELLLQPPGRFRAPSPRSAGRGSRPRSSPRYHGAHARNRPGGPGARLRSSACQSRGRAGGRGCRQRGSPAVPCRPCGTTHSK